MWSGETVAIFAGGPSMNRNVADQVIAAGITSIAINDSYKLALEADVLLAADPEWWNANPYAMEFAGEKIVMRKGAEGPTYIAPVKLGPGSNSALQAAHLAVRRGARSIFLFGVDLRDDELTHHHGLHAGDLPNPSPEAFRHAREAWQHFARHRLCYVVNCSLRSALECFPKRSPADVLC